MLLKLPLIASPGAAVAVAAAIAGGRNRRAQARGPGAEDAASVDGAGSRRQSSRMLQAAQGQARQIRSSTNRSSSPASRRRGNASAKVTLVEVSDYHCPFCRRQTLQTMPQVLTDYVNTGKVKYVFVDYPIAQLHPDAFAAHEAAACAGDQGKYWQMHDSCSRTRRHERSRSSPRRQRRSASTKQVRRLHERKGRTPPRSGPASNACSSLVSAARR